MTTTWRVRPVLLDDEHEWLDLYAGYRAFYEMPADAARDALVWSWLHDGASGVRGLVATEGTRLGGIAVLRTFERPLDGSHGCWLDDLFVAEAARGAGVGRLLLGAVGVHAGDLGASVVRWITDPANATARRLYDSVATATPWVTYDMSPGDGRLG
ncbi:MAG: family N-acetyltransferase [Oerskovia sp.]|nr:family N-acetyltransferase [Oerskovia sp.]